MKMNRTVESTLLELSMSKLAKEWIFPVLIWHMESQFTNLFRFAFVLLITTKAKKPRSSHRCHSYKKIHVTEISMLQIIILSLVRNSGASEEEGNTLDPKSGRNNIGFLKVSAPESPETILTGFNASTVRKPYKWQVNSQYYRCRFSHTPLYPQWHCLGRVKVCSYWGMLWT